MKLRYLLATAAVFPALAVARNALHRRKISALYAKAESTQAELRALEYEEHEGWTLTLIPADFIDGDTYKPHYEIGAPVIVSCPYTTDNYREPEHGIITDRTLNENEAYVYRVTGQDGWINENWLEYDALGPKQISVQPAPKAGLVDEVAINYYLATLKSAIATGDAREYEVATEGLTEIRRRREGA